MLAFAGLVIMVTALVLLPLAPALAEWQLQRDVDPLRVDRKHEGNVRYFAERFRESLEKALRGPLAQSLEAITRERDFRHPEGFQVVGIDGRPQFSEKQKRAGICGETLVSARSLTLPDRFVFRAEIYGAQSIDGGEGSVFRAILAEGDLRLGARSAVLDWAHGYNVFVGRKSELLGRTSADALVRIEGPCRFSRLHATRIDFGQPTASPAESALRIWPALDLSTPEAIERHSRRTLSEGNAEVADDTLFDGQLVAQGNARVGKRALVTGSIKSHGDLRIGEDSIVYGAVISAKSLTLESGARVLGPLVAETELVLGAGCIVGEQDRPTSLTAPRIRIAAGAVVFGTVWAREHGEASA